MRYRTEKGLQICEEGTVVIEGVRHYVRAGYVYCDPALNHRAWNVTEAVSTCEVCKLQIEAGTGQLELFA